MLYSERFCLYKSEVILQSETLMRDIDVLQSDLQVFSQTNITLLTIFMCNVLFCIMFGILCVTEDF